MAKAKDQGTLVTFLLDRTASMGSIKSQTIEAFNEYLDGLKQSKARIDFTFLQFDTQSLDKICVAEPVGKVKPLTNESYQPRASTNLIDSAYDTIKAVEGQEKAKNKKIVICFQTDGEENSSHKHTWEELKALIAEKTKLGWQFNFMGAGIDAYNQASMMGLQAAQTMSYSNDRASTRAAFVGAARNTASYAAGFTDNTHYLDSQKVAAGDKFFQPLLRTTPTKPTQNLNLNPGPSVTGVDFSLND